MKNGLMIVGEYCGGEVRTMEFADPKTGRVTETVSFVHAVLCRNGGMPVVYQVAERLPAGTKKDEVKMPAHLAGKQVRAEIESVGAGKNGKVYFRLAVLELAQ